MGATITPYRMAVQGGGQDFLKFLVESGLTSSDRVW